MRKCLKFVKLANRWFVILPEYEGAVEELEMVAGADKLLETLSDGNSVVSLEISDSPTSFDGILMIRQEMDDMGATYLLGSGTVWLCNVTKYVLGEFPKYIYFRTVHYEG